MRKLSQILAVGAMILAPLAITADASALGTCEIGYTGPDSSNKCISTTKYVCTVDNSNNLQVKNDNGQVAASGTATGEGNGSLGSVNSGTATNSNGVTFDVNVTNTVDVFEGICTVVASVPATNPGGGGAGGVTPEVPAPAPVVTQPVPAPLGQGRGAAIATLPNTSGETPLTYVAQLIGLFGVSVVLSRLVVMAYSHSKA